MLAIGSAIVNLFRNQTKNKLTTPAIITNPKETATRREKSFPPKKKAIEPLTKVLEKTEIIIDLVATESSISPERESFDMEIVMASTSAKPAKALDK